MYHNEGGRHLLGMVLYLVEAWLIWGLKEGGGVC